MPFRKHIFLILFFLIPASAYSQEVAPAQVESTKAGYLAMGINIILNLSIAGQHAWALSGDFQKEHFGTDIFSFTDQELAPAELRALIQGIGKGYGIPYIIPVYILKNNYAVRMSPGIVATNGTLYIAQNDLFSLNQNGSVSALAQFFIHDAVLQLNQSLYTKRVLSSLGLGMGCYSLCSHLIDKSVYGSLAFLGYPVAAQVSWAAFAAQIPLSLFCGIVSSTATSFLSQNMWGLYADYALRQRLNKIEGVDKELAKKELLDYINKLNPHDMRKRIVEHYAKIL